jgi:hypothetical protein
MDKPQPTTVVETSTQVGDSVVRLKEMDCLSSAGGIDHIYIYDNTVNTTAQESVTLYRQLRKNFLVLLPNPWPGQDLQTIIVPTIRILGERSSVRGRSQLSRTLRSTLTD